MPLTPYPQADASGRILYSFSTWVTKESSHELTRGDPRLNAIGGVSLAGNGGDLTNFGAPLITSLLNTRFELVFWCRRRAGSDERHRTLATINTSGGEVSFSFGNSIAGSGYSLGFGDSYGYQVANPDQWHVVTFGRDTVGWFFTCDGVVTSVSDGSGVSGLPVSITRMFGGIFGGYGQMAGDVARVLWFQDALTVNQRAKMMLGDMDTAMLSVLHGRWEPLNVTMLPRWLDSSGNGNDLVPAAGHGMTPLNPQPATVRVQGFSVNTASTVDTNAAGPLYTVTKSGTGTVVFTPKAILGTRPNWVASNAATGQDTVTSSIQTNGANTVQAHRNNVVVDDTIEGVIAHLE